MAVSLRRIEFLRYRPFLKVPKPQDTTGRLVAFGLGGSGQPLSVRRYSYALDLATFVVAEGSLQVPRRQIEDVNLDRNKPIPMP